MDHLQTAYCIAGRRVDWVLPVVWLWLWLCWLLCQIRKRSKGKEKNKSQQDIAVALLGWEYIVTAMNKYLPVH